MSDDIETWCNTSGRPMFTIHHIGPDAPASSREHPRRQRKPNLAAAIRQADRAGANVTGATVKPDGSVALEFGKADDPHGTPAEKSAPENDLDKWMAKRHEN